MNKEQTAQAVATMLFTLAEKVEVDEVANLPEVLTMLAEMLMKEGE